MLFFAGEKKDKKSGGARWFFSMAVIGVAVLLTGAGRLSDISSGRSARAAETVNSMREAIMKLAKAVPASEREEWLECVRKNPEVFLRASHTVDRI